MPLITRDHRIKALPYLWNGYRVRLTSVTTILVIAGMAEGIGIISLLPLLGAITDSTASSESVLTDYVLSALAAIQLSPTPGILLSLIVVGISLKVTFVSLGMRQAGYAAADLASDLRLSLIRALMAARWKHFTEVPMGKLANAVSSEATLAAEVFVRAGNLIACSVQVLVYGVLALLVSWYVTLGAAVFGLLMVLLLSSLVRLARKAGEQHTWVLRSLVSRLSDSLTSIKPLKAMAWERSIQPVLEEETEDLNVAQRQQIFSNAALMALQEGFIVLVLAIGVYFALTRLQLAFEELAFMAFLFQRTVVRIGDLQHHYQQLGEREAVLSSIVSSVHEAEAAREPEGGTIDPVLNREIRFEKVSFSHGSKQVLEKTNLSMPARKMTAVVGPSGSGKTTIADLIIGLLEPDEGQILIDDTPLADANLRAWRSKIGYVPQEVLLLHDSIFVNVGLKDPRIAPADVEEALKAAGGWDFVEALEDGLESEVGERGLKLSGGQRQRIAIARALVRKPTLLILDEATTGLDTDTERAVVGTLNQLKSELTILVISHQTTVVEAADVVFDLKSAPLANSGN